jgi:cell division protein FtsI/penicillin-binding protein 2
MNASGSRRIERVGWLAALGMTSLMALVVGRVAQLQTAPSEALLAQRQERTTTARVPGTRGDVLDAKSRLLATTRFGSRVFVDPERLDPKRVDQTIAELSDVLALPPEEIATPVLQAIARNERIKAARGTGVALVNLRSEEPPTETSIDLAGDGERADDSSQANVLGEMKLSRYVRISGVVNEAIAAAVTRLKIAGVHLEQRPVREYPVGELAAGCCRARRCRSWRGSRGRAPIRNDVEGSRRAAGVCA